MPNQQCQRVNPRKARPAGWHDEVGRSVGGGGVGAFLWCQRFNPRKACPAGWHEVGRSVVGGEVGSFLWPSWAPRVSAPKASADRRTG